MTIHDDIQRLVEQGIPMDDILVNDGQSAWGETCAVSRTQAREVVEEWGAGDINDLESASYWLDEHSEDDK